MDTPPPRSQKGEGNFNASSVLAGFFGAPTNDKISTGTEATRKEDTEEWLVMSSAFVCRIKRALEMT